MLYRIADRPQEPLPRLKQKVQAHARRHEALRDRAYSRRAPSGVGIRVSRCPLPRIPACE